jgi:large subunit ribosomal protein L22
MGARKRTSANVRKEELKSTSFAKLNNCPTSPRKMRLVADMIRGKKVETALNSLRFSTKEASGRLEKVLLSAISNWQAKNEGQRIEDHELFVKDVFVDSGRQLKRLRTAPQGRGHRIRKRSNHITLVLDTKNAIQAQETTNTVTE